MRRVSRIAVTAGVALGLLFGTAGLAAAQVPGGDDVTDLARQGLQFVDDLLKNTEKLVDALENEIR